ncbi:DsbA family protein [Polycladidibacter stylochi]|uniref:DsbA family protein n=1 Tax=Polycladidibacter stylochi TaxID=1807766 RepID=UPI0008301A54|nr:DsbA family protein [Pseudovibrio stylochi]
MTLTRRSFVNRSSALVLAAGLCLALPFTSIAQAATKEELMQPSPLGDMALGEKNAPVTIVEYASLTCSHCATFHNTTYAKLKEKYIDTGKVHFIFREFPLDTVAAAGSMLVRCSAPEKQLTVLGTMFHEQRNWAFTDNPYGALLKMGKQIGLSEKEVESCLTNQKILDGLTATREHASKVLGVNSTPTFFINGEKVSGALSIDQISEYIDKNL